MRELERVRMKENDRERESKREGEREREREREGQQEEKKRTIDCGCYLKAELGVPRGPTLGHGTRGLRSTLPDGTHKSTAGCSPRPAPQDVVLVTVEL